MISWRNWRHSVKNNYNNNNNEMMQQGERELNDQLAELATQCEANDQENVGALDKTLVNTGRRLLLSSAAVV